MKYSGQETKSDEGRREKFGFLDEDFRSGRRSDRMDDGLRPVDFIGGRWSVCRNFVLCQQISATLTDSSAEPQRDPGWITLSVDVRDAFSSPQVEYTRYLRSRPTIRRSSRPIPQRYKPHRKAIGSLPSLSSVFCAPFSSLSSRLSSSGNAFLNHVFISPDGKARIIPDIDILQLSNM